MNVVSGLLQDGELTHEQSVKVCSFYVVINMKENFFSSYYTSIIILSFCRLSNVAWKVVQEPTQFFKTP